MTVLHVRSGPAGLPWLVEGERQPAVAGSPRRLLLTRQADRCDSARPNLHRPEAEPVLGGRLGPERHFLTGHHLPIAAHHDRGEMHPTTAGDTRAVDNTPALVRVELPHHTHTGHDHSLHDDPTQETWPAASDTSREHASGSAAIRARPGRPGSRPSVELGAVVTRSTESIRRSGVSSHQPR